MSAQLAHQPKYPPTSNKTYLFFIPLDFCDAPHRICEEQGGGDGQSLGWWFSREDNYYKAREHSDIDKGFQQSIDEIKRVFAEQVSVDNTLSLASFIKFYVD